MPENNEIKEVQEQTTPECCPFDENVKVFKLPAYVLYLVGGLAVDGLYHVGRTAVDLAIKYGPKVAGSVMKLLRKSKEEPMSEYEEVSDIPEE
jgi:hypothetical protein